MRNRTAIARAGDCIENGPEILETTIHGRNWMHRKGAMNDVVEKKGLYFPDRNVLVPTWCRTELSLQLSFLTPSLPT